MSLIQHYRGPRSISLNMALHNPLGKHAIHTQMHATDRQTDRQQFAKSRKLGLVNDKTMELLQTDMNTDGMQSIQSLRVNQRFLHLFTPKTPLCVAIPTIPLRYTLHHTYIIVQCHACRDNGVVSRHHEVLSITSNPGYTSENLR